MLGRCSKPPIGTWVINAKKIANRNVNPNIVIFTTSFDQQNIATLVLAESICEHTSRCSGTNDDVIKVANTFLQLHESLRFAIM